MLATHDMSTLRKNGLLAVLPQKDHDRLQRLLEPISLSFKEVLCEPDEPIRYVYFPTGGIISLLLVMEDGFTAEVGQVGTEGIVGLPVFLGVDRSHVRALVEMPGEALRMTVQAFRREVSRGGMPDGALQRYTQALMNQISQVTACNNRHSIEQRLCRWLLMTQDRVATEQFEVTQEFLSQVLGVHRPSITLAASGLQKAGLIRYSRGKLTILDREGLETASCECYRAIRKGFNGLLMDWKTDLSTGDGVNHSDARGHK